MTNIRRNDLNQPIGKPLPDWDGCRLPPRTPMIGRYCRVEPLHPDAHAAHLFDAYQSDKNGANWTYLPYGPFPTRDEFNSWLDTVSENDDPMFFTIFDNATDRPAGVASYLSLNPSIGVIEVGHIHYSTELQQTPAATEAMFLMMSRVFDELGYRRYEWKCDALNAASRKAALRLGFSFEGLFRQATIYKGRSRDTAWFSIIDQDWAVIKKAFQEWLSSNNHDSLGHQRQRLTGLIERMKAEQ